MASSGRMDGTGGLSKRTIGHAHRVLSKALKEASRFDLVVKNAATDQPPPTAGESEVVIVEQHRIDDLVAKIAGRSIYPKAIVALYTGVRRGELLALRWGNIDLDQKIMRVREALEQTKKHGIRFKTPKTRSGRRDISLPDIVVEALREYRRSQLELRLKLSMGKLADDDLLFPALDDQPRIPRSPRALSSEWADFASSIGMGDVVFHALRHTHASQLIDAGVDIVTISKRLGHANPNITLKVYAHLFRNGGEKAADAINAALANRGNA